MTIKRFMWMDIIMLTVWAILIDVIAYFITSWIAESSLELIITESVFIAPSFVIIYLVYQRWGYKGYLTHLVSMILQFILYRQQIFAGYQYPIMIITSYLMFLCVLLVKYLISKNPKFNFWFTHVISFILIYALSFMTEWLTGTILGLDLSLIGIILRHTTNLILCVLILIVMSLQKELIIDMKTHLINQSKKEEDYV